MKSFLFMICLLPFTAQALDYKLLNENEHTRVSKIKLMPGEEVGLHRDDLPRTVIGLKGGIIKRIEEDGSTKEIVFPTGEAVFLEADPIGEQHKGVNISAEPLEIIVIEYKKA